MKFSEFSAKGQNEVRAYTHQRWEQLNKLVLANSDRANRQLFFTNAGGAIAIMSFLGTKTDIPDVPMIYAALSCFIMGLIHHHVFNRHPDSPCEFPAFGVEQGCPQILQKRNGV
jgi:hypothetical protein